MINLIIACLSYVEKPPKLSIIMLMVLLAMFNLIVLLEQNVSYCSSGGDLLNRTEICETTSDKYPILMQRLHLLLFHSLKSNHLSVTNTASFIISLTVTKTPVVIFTYVVI